MPFNTNNSKSSRMSIMERDDKLLIRAHRVVDVLLSGVAFVAAYLVRKHCFPAAYGDFIETPNYYVALLLIIIISHVSFSYSNIHSKHGRIKRCPYLYQIISTVTINTMILGLFFFVLAIKDISRIMIFLFYIFNIVMIMFSCLTVSALYRKKGYSNLLVVIIGSRESAKELIESVIHDPNIGYLVHGCLDTDSESVGKDVAGGIKVVGTLDQLEQVLTENVIDEIIFAMPIYKAWEAQQYLAIAEAMGVQIRILPHWHLRRFLQTRPSFYSMRFEEFYGNPTLVLSAAPQKRGALLFKAAFDFVVAAVAMLLVIPFCIIIGLLIKLVSPGPAFYEQERCGLYGRRFTLYKFRTMVPDADKMLPELLDKNVSDGPTFKMESDPRVIPYIGTFLRKTGMDELPQLINVLRGEMSIVGPRPALPEEVKRYELWERRRMSMKPGVTCIWQISPNRNRIPFKKWMEMDLTYIDNWSLWLDMKLFFGTFKSLVLRYGM
jgi:exopolysaccharide biosynthesis polyprenyl glycosylphosphotransferase